MFTRSEHDLSMQEQDRSTILWQSYRSGDDHALEELVKIYRDDLLYFVNGYTHNMTSAEDIVSEAFLRLICCAKNFRGDASLKTYLYRIAVNKAIDELRKSENKVTVSLDDVEYLASEEKELDDLVLQNEKRKILSSAMQKLNTEYRTVLFLKYFEYLSCDETAKVIRKSKKQTENLLCRAKVSLKIILEKEGYNNEDV